MRKGGECRAERARRGVLEIYMLEVVLVQCRVIGNDSLVGAAGWGRRRGLSPMMQAWSSGMGCVDRG
jgi:hypothetical protein